MFQKTLWGSTRLLPDVPGEDGWSAEVAGVIDDLTDLAEAAFFRPSTTILEYAIAAASTLAAGATLTRTNRLHRLTGNGGAVTLSVVTAIADGTKDGEVLELEGGHAANKVTIPHGANTSMAQGKPVTLALGETLRLRWNLATTTWIETGRSGPQYQDAATLDLYELAANGSDKVSLRAPDALAASYTLVFPADDGAAGQFLRTDGAGVLSWANDTSTLDSAYDNGRTVAVDAGAIVLNAAAAHNGLEINVLGTGEALAISGGGILMPNAEFIYGANSTGTPTKLIDRDGANVLQLGDPGFAYATHLHCGTAGGGELSIRFADVAKALVAKEGEIRAASAIFGAAALTTAATAPLEVQQPSSAATKSALVLVKAGTGTGAVLDITNAGTGAGISIFQQGVGYGLLIHNDSAAEALHINQHGNAHCISFGNTGSGYDLSGTGATWSIDKIGQAIFTSIYLFNGATGQLWYAGTAAPGAGAHVKGEVYWNSDPDSGEPIGWVCTVAGTPGTWKAFGTIA